MDDDDDFIIFFGLYSRDTLYGYKYKSHTADNYTLVLAILRILSIYY